MAEYQQGHFSDVRQIEYHTLGPLSFLNLGCPRGIKQTLQFGVQGQQYSTGQNFVILPPVSHSFHAFHVVSSSVLSSHGRGNLDALKISSGQDITQTNQQRMIFRTAT